MSGGGQWRSLRRLSLGSLQAEAERLLQRLRVSLSQEQWDNVMQRVEKLAWSRVLSADKQRVAESAPAAAPAPQEAGPEPVPAAAPAPQEVSSEPAPAAVVSASLQAAADKQAGSVPLQTAADRQAGPAPQAPAPGSGSDAGGSLWLQSVLQGLRLRTDLALGSAAQPRWSSRNTLHNKGSLQARTAHVVCALAASTDPVSRVKRTEELLLHVRSHPECSAAAVRAGAVRALLRAAAAGGGAAEAAREALAALGAAAPPAAPGPRVLALDGGGIRGLVAITLLRRLEALTGRRVAQLFDYMIGVSTGAIIAAIIGSGAGSLDDAADMYKKLSREMFGGTSLVRGGARLVWSHAYYDTAAWERLLQHRLGDRTLGACTPHLALVSCTTRGGALQPHVFTSYGAGGAARVWRAVRASAAAPTYFHELVLDGQVHQDGGICHNNPAGLALRELRALWGGTEAARATLVSLGSGRVLPPPAALHAAPSEPPPTSWRDKFNRILDSATDTEGTHRLLAAVLPAHRYYRLNPPLLQACSMDETDERKLCALLEATEAYMRRNEHKLERVAAALTRPRPIHSRLQDYCKKQAVLLGLRNTL